MAQQKYEGDPTIVPWGRKAYMKTPAYQRDVRVRRARKVTGAGIAGAIAGAKARTTARRTKLAKVMNRARKRA